MQQVRVVWSLTQGCGLYLWKIIMTQFSLVWFEPHSNDSFTCHSCWKVLLTEYFSIWCLLGALHFCLHDAQLTVFVELCECTLKVAIRVRVCRCSAHTGRGQLAHEHNGSRAPFLQPPLLMILLPCASPAAPCQDLGHTDSPKTTWQQWRRQQQLIFFFFPVNPLHQAWPQGYADQEGCQLQFHLRVPLRNQHRPRLARWPVTIEMVERLDFLYCLGLAVAVIKNYPLVLGCSVNKNMVLLLD